MRRNALWIAVLLIVLGPVQGRLAETAAAAPSATASSPAGVQAAVPLGTVTTVLVPVDNSGQPAVTAQLYEAFDTPARPTGAPPAAPLRVPLPDAPGPITPGLLAAFSSAPDGRSDMIIYLADQADLSAAAALPDWNARGAAVVAQLQQEAASQAPLLAQLRQAGYSPRSFWIVNAIEVKGDRALAESMAGQPGVALVAANVKHPLALEPASSGPAGLGNPAWGLERIGAPGVWSDWGDRGAGITVASLDTGVAYSNTALLHQYRGWSPAGVSHAYNWFDPADDPPLAIPRDSAGHGTHTMGIMLGGAAGGYSALGVAPDARWIAVRGCDGIFCDDAALIAGAQWLLAPTDLSGKNPRPDLRPQIINNSWGQAGSAPWYAGYVTAWNAAGIFPAFAAGNSGAFATCENTLTPGNYANSFDVGATDNQDNIASFSSRGPTDDGRIKPDLSAPGVNIPSTWPDGSVKLLSGTSMAAPHVAGVVALLWSANPTLIGDIAATQHVLTSTVLPLPTTECGSPSTTVPNNVYGWGRLDARAAVQQARVDIAWMSLPAALDLPANGQAAFPLTLDGRQVSLPGTYTARVLVMRNNSLTAIPVSFTVQPAPNTASLHGHLSDLWLGGSVYGRVQMGAGPAVHADPDGYYTATLPYGSYVLTASANGYFSATLNVALSAPAAADFILQPDLPHVEWSTGPLSATLAFGQHVSVPITLTNGGTQPLSVTTSVPAYDWVVAQGGATAGPLYNLSSTPPVSLTDDSIYTQPLELGFQVPIFGALVDQLYLSSNGWVSAVDPTSSEPQANCLPNFGLPPFSLAPFWADLDPGVGGKVRFARVSPDTFVVSFEKVPPWRETPDPSGPTYTFQLVLHANGQIQYLYGLMGALPDRWSVGASFDVTRGQSLACYKQSTVLSGTAWSLRNQPSSSFWLSASVPGVAVLPGATTTLNAVLSGYGYAAWHPDPFQGTLRLTTNDPAQPTVDLPAQALVGDAPYRTVLPVVSR
jgi:subtilisin family serine protease